MSLLSQVLSTQHRRVLELLDETEEAPRSSILELLADAIVGHTLVEEELVYPACNVSLGSAAYAVEEHALVRYALQRLLDAKPGHVSFDARLRVVRDLLVHHSEREERAQMPRLEKNLGVRRSRKLAEQVAARFSQLVARGYRSALARGR